MYIQSEYNSPQIFFDDYRLFIRALDYISGAFLSIP